MTGPTKDDLERMYRDCAVTVNPMLSCEVLQNNRQRYEAVQIVPWWVVAIIHRMESDGRFSTHLHNGDPLTARTVHVPKHRPVYGNPPFGWEESARDAMRMMNFDAVPWDYLGSALYALEGYNGYGYRHKGIFSPYLWSGTSYYTEGKYVADGKWDEHAVSKQVGCVPLMKGLRLFPKELI